MMLDYSEPIELNIFILYILHGFLSLILGFILAYFTQKRFVRKGEKIEKRDRKRLEEIGNKNIIFKSFFKVSLHKNNYITNSLFNFLFLFAMPGIGYILALWITYYLRHISYDKKVSNTNILNLDEFGISFLKVERIFGEGSMKDLMTNKYAPKSKKLKALASLSSHLSPANLKIIRSTLSSTDDEIRMYGYATINKAEKAINTKINQHLIVYNEELEKGLDKDKEKLGLAAKELAELYWELVYTEISHESLKQGFIQEVSKYIKSAKSYYLPESKIRMTKFRNVEILIEENKKALLEEPTKSSLKDEAIELKEKYKKLKETILNTNVILTKLFVLMGKSYMLEKNYERAQTEFTIAQELYAGKSSFILPYLAEIQYLMGNYHIVNSIMNEAEALSINATLHPIVEQWKIS